MCVTLIGDGLVKMSRGADAEIQSTKREQSNPGQTGMLRRTSAALWKRKTVVGGLAEGQRHKA
jgi:hypothetical protein